MPTITYKKIASYTAPSDSTSPVTFSNISQAYKHLIIHVNYREFNQGSEWGFFGISSISGSTSSNLYNQYTRWLGGGYNTDQQANNYMNFMYINGDGSLSGFYGNAILYIPDYTVSGKYKTVYNEMCQFSTATQTYGGMGGYGSGILEQNLAVTDITFGVSNGIKAGSSFALYGLSNA